MHEFLPHLFCPPARPGERLAGPGPALAGPPALASHAVAAVTAVIRGVPTPLVRTGAVTAMSGDVISDGRDRTT